MELVAKPSSAGATPSQTLARGLDVLEQVATGAGGLGAIAARLGLSRTTVHRLASSLVERRYLNLTPRRGYSLGPKLLELGCAAREQIALVRAAAPIMERLAEETGDAVLLSVREGDEAVTAGYVAGRRRLAPRLGVGERAGICRGAAGLAFLLDAGAEELAALMGGVHGGEAGDVKRRLAEAAAAGIVLDEPSCPTDIATMAAPVRGADGRIAAAIGLAMAAPFREAGMAPPAREAVRRAGAELSAELGWSITNTHAGAPEGGAARELLSLPEAHLGSPEANRGGARLGRRGRPALTATTTS